MEEIAVEACLRSPRKLNPKAERSVVGLAAESFPRVREIVFREWDEAHPRRIRTGRRQSLLRCVFLPVLHAMGSIGKECRAGTENPRVRTYNGRSHSQRRGNAVTGVLTVIVEE